MSSVFNPSLDRLILESLKEKLPSKINKIRLLRCIRAMEDSDFEELNSRVDLNDRKVNFTRTLKYIQATIEDSIEIPWQENSEDRMIQHLENAIEEIQYNKDRHTNLLGEKE